jgi:hypothetical protein
VLLQFGDCGAEFGAVLCCDVDGDVEGVACAEDFGCCCYSVSTGVVRTVCIPGGGGGGGLEWKEGEREQGTYNLGNSKIALVNFSWISQTLMV